MLPVDMVQDIEDYKEDNRIQTNHQAIRALIQKGLDDSEA